MRSTLVAAFTGLLMAFSFATQAQTPIKVGMTGTFTGPNASTGIPYRNAAELYPKTLGGQPVEWIILDDGGDVTQAMKNARRFIDVDKVDAIIGSTSTPTAATLFDVANSSKTMQLACSPVIISEAKRPFVFSVSQPVSLMDAAVVQDMKGQGVKTAAYIGYADGWGDLNWDIFKDLAAKAGIKVVAAERYNRTDPSVTAQALKIMAVEPDAVFVGASTTPAGLPQTTLRDQGYKGLIYQTHGAAAQAFVDAAGKSAEGARLPTTPLVVAGELPDANPIKKVALDFVGKYQAKWGKGQVPAFAGTAWDAYLILDAAAAKAVKSGAKPGTEPFRVALRDAAQSGAEVVGTDGVFKYTEADHYGLDERARVMVTVGGGKFRLLK